MNNVILTLVSIWVGVIIFFSIIVAPTVFKSIDERNASLFLRAFFPKYYVFGITIGFLCVVFYSLRESSQKILLDTSFLLIIVMLIFSIISKVMIPFINKARDVGDVGKSRFKRLHLISVLFNMSTLVIGLSYIYINL